MKVLGIKVAGHDTGAALIADGKIVAIAEERLSRIKYSDGAFPARSIQYCLDALNVSPDQIDLIAVDPTIVDKATWESSADVIAREVASRFPNARVEKVNHHDAHAAAAFFCSPFDEAAILVYDGSGELIKTHYGTIASETETLYKAKGTHIEQIHKTLHAKSARRFPYTMGLGKLYSFFSRDYIKFGAHNEGKMMGLAAYGDDRFLKQFPYERFVTERYGEMLCNADIRYPKASVAEKTKSAGWGRIATVAYWGTRLRLLRMRDSFIRRLSLNSGESPYADPHVFDPVELERPARDTKAVTLPDDYYSSVAYAAQKIFERFAVEIGRHLKQVTGAENLCVAGGCALNIDANRNFLTEVGFKDIFVQPASSDCGIALGCALWGYHVTLEQPRFWVMKSASLGRPYSDEEIDAAIRERGQEIVHRVSDDIANDAAKLIADGKILGWFQGGAEYGPRALGNRSIICDARPKEMRDILNKRVKHREMWRPFATSILAERLGEWFDLQPSSTTAFMLLCGTVHEAKRELVPSIVHVDNTCRMQTLTKEDNGVYYDLVKAFEDITGTPLIINTSFNLGGEPIVETPADALHTFLRTDMDYLILGDRVIQKAK